MDYPHSSKFIYPCFCRKVLDMLHFPPLAADEEKRREFFLRNAENSQYLGRLRQEINQGVFFPEQELLPPLCPTGSQDKPKTFAQEEKG